MHYQTYIDQGGLILIILLVLLFVGINIMLWKFFTLLYYSYHHKKICINCSVLIEDRSNYIEVQHKVQESISKLEIGLTTIKIIASISPLLGLLGTVVGIYSAFSAIGAHGLGDPSYFAKGISMALITTIAGLSVAVPHYVGYNYLAGMLDKLELLFETEIYCPIRSMDA